MHNIVVMHVEHKGLRNTIHHLHTHTHKYLDVGRATQEMAPSGLDQRVVQEEG